MKIRMLETVPGSIDGIRVASYEAGTEYDLSATAGELDLAAAFVGAGFAEVVGEVESRADDVDPGEQVDSQDIAPARSKPGRKAK